MAGSSDAFLQAEAFKRIYPDQYFAKFVEQAVRPDGRPLARARPVSVSLGVVTTADASALVKVGSTTVLAGIKCEITPATGNRPDQGSAALEIEMAPMCSPHCRPGRPSERGEVLAEQLSAVIIGSDTETTSTGNTATAAQKGLLDLCQLCIDPGKSAWALSIDVYVLDDDGALHEACALAAIAALRALRLPHVEKGTGDALAKRSADGCVAKTSVAWDGGEEEQQRALELRFIPVWLTCALHGGRLLIDPTAEEEEMVASMLVVAVDEVGQLVAVEKPGGRANLTQEALQECHEAAKARAADVRGILEAALQQR